VPPLCERNAAALVPTLPAAKRDVTDLTAATAAAAPVPWGVTPGLALTNLDFLVA
jgi:hypothetical protein